MHDVYMFFVYMLVICLPIIPALMKDVLFWFVYFSLDVSFPKLPSSRSVTRMTSETLLMKIRKRYKTDITSERLIGFKNLKKMVKYCNRVGEGI